MMSTAAAGDERLKRLPPREHFARGDQHRRSFAQLRESPRRRRAAALPRTRPRRSRPACVAVSRAQLTPCGQNCSLPPASTISSTSSPTVSRAVWISSSSSLRLTRPNGRQPILMARKPRAICSLQLFGQHGRIVEQDRGIGLDPIAIVSAQQFRDRLAERLAPQVPQRDVEAADRVFDRAAAAQPEHRSAACVSLTRLGSRADWPISSGLSSSSEPSTSGRVV